MKKLIEDPWSKALERYKVGQLVHGKILKTNSFGAFVELDREIHGLVHISELSDKLVRNPGEVVKPGEEYEFKILSIEPNHHRLGLTLKGANVKDEPAKPAESVEEVKTAEPETAESTPEPTAPVEK